MAVNPEFFRRHMVRPEETDEALDALDAWIYRYTKPSTQTMIIFHTAGNTSTRMFKLGGHITRFDKLKIVDAALDSFDSIPDKRAVS